MSQLYGLEPWGPIVMLPGSTPAGGELLISVTKCGTGCWALSPAQFRERAGSPCACCRRSAGSARRGRGLGLGSWILGLGSWVLGLGGGPPAQ
ncbi:hypothetical protein F2Q69_00025029 [Brassica cretica]|uniref:Uncharacterized protein n=1 Tax=Brassica cretica TaxID=69181 RepID=A0A8S9Q6Q2_BRACR|nr:hypothetical protein F2Q69_00025029 [Brassica cretica]